MRVLQVIDSLQVGGAERMAVNYANGLVDRIDGSYLCATREEGDLKSEILEKVEYLFLNRRSTLDFKAIRRLLKFIEHNKITIIHAHGSSWFISAFAKMLSPGIKLVWHDHLGSRGQSIYLHKKTLSLFSLRFDYVITTSDSQFKWCMDNLRIDRIEFIPNFVNDFKINKIKNENIIVHLANLRNPKNHLMSIKAFAIVSKRYPTWKFQLIGKDYNDTYSCILKRFIINNGLNDTIQILGQRNDIKEFLYRASIGVLSSEFEGLPLALLEYGMAGLPVVVTDVGQCGKVVGENGIVVPVGEVEAFAAAILETIENKEESATRAIRLHEAIKMDYSKNAILTRVIDIYAKLD